MNKFILFIYDDTLARWRWYKDYKSKKKCRKVFDKSGYEHGRIARGDKCVEYLVQY